VRSTIPLALVALATLPAPALAQSGGITVVQPGGGQPQEQPSEQESPARPVGAYAGHVPGAGNMPPRPPPPEGERRILTWPGFQARDDGASRFFLQTNGPVRTETSSEEGRFVVLLQNTRIHLRNNRRTLETRYFDTPVGRARIERRGNDVALVLELRAQVTPNVSNQQGQSGYWFVLVQFPSGNWLPEELRLQREGSSSEEDQPSGGRGATQATDTERPPGFGQTP